MSDGDSGQVRWSVVVPVKRLAEAKSRLRVLGDDARQALALAFAEDVVRAALACEAVDSVVVVTDDDDVARAAAGIGATVVADQPASGIDAALEHGADVARRSRPQHGVAAVAADLPALTASELADVLRSVAGRGVVPDAAGSGTTVLAAAPGRALRAAYGTGSLTRHLAGGAVLLPAAAGVRRDVDTPADLREALALGVGPATRAVAQRLQSDDVVACTS